MLETVRRLFADPNSDLYSVAMRGATPRIEQGDYAVSVARCIAEGGIDEPSIGLLQASTGIGKSLGYLVPSMLSAAQQGCRVIVSTHTIALQKQVMDFVPSINDMLVALDLSPLTAAHRIGKRNFLSIEQFRLFAKQHRALEPDAPIVPILERIVEAMDADPTMTTIQNVTEHFGRDIHRAGGLPFAIESCRIGQEEGDDAVYAAMVSDAKDVDVLVVNHALLALDIMTGGVLLRQSGDDRETVYIVDEADALPDVIQSMLSRRLPFVLLRSMADRLRKSGAPGWKALVKSIDVLSELQQNALDTFQSHRFSGSDRRAEIIPIHRGIPAAWRQSLAATLKRLHGQLEALKPHGHGMGMHETIVDSILDIEALLSAINEIEAGDVPWRTPAMYWTPARQQPGLLVTGGTPGMITSNLWRKQTMRAKAIVFTSATLSGTTDEVGRPTMLDFAIRVGMSEAHRQNALIDDFAPHDFGRMDFVVVDQRLAPRSSIPRPLAERGDDEEDDDSPIVNPEAVQWWAALVRAAMKEDNGRVLVLPTSYTKANMLAEAIGEVPGWTIVLDTPGRSDALMRFVDDERSVLIAPGRWAGLNLPGQVRHIVVPDIPFAPPDAIQNESFERYLATQRKKNDERLDTRDKRQRRLPANVAQAKRKLGQGLGRGVRKHDDVVTIWIGDKRWPATRSRIDSGEQTPDITPAARGVVGAVPARFREALENAQGFTPQRGRFAYTRAVATRRAHDLELE